MLSSCLTHEIGFTISGIALPLLHYSLSFDIFVDWEESELFYTSMYYSIVKSVFTFLSELKGSQSLLKKIVMSGLDI